MAKWNTKATGAQKTRNYENEEAYELTPELELYQRVATAMLQDSFYETEAQRTKRLRKLLTQVDPEFAWQLTVFARQEMNLRSVPIFLAIELTKMGHPNREGIRRVIQRADEITELLAYYNKANGLGTNDGMGNSLTVTPLANSIKRGIRDVFEEETYEGGRTDEYSLAKYDRDGGVTLRDALFLTHPTAQDDYQEEVFGKLANDQLETPTTWEVKLTEAGQSEDKTKTEAWEEMIEIPRGESGHLPAFAAVRNLRNLLEADVSREHILTVAERIRDPSFIRGTGILPFQFYSAYQALQPVQHPGKKPLLNALEDAAQVASENIPHFGPEESVLIATDTSGSMNHKISARSSMRYVDVGLVMSNLLANKCDWVRHIGFHTTLEDMPLHPDKPLASASDYRPDGGATNGHLVIEAMRQNGWEVDKLFVFSDMQLWNTDNASAFGRRNDPGQGSFAKEWQAYREENPELDTTAYLFDLKGYGDTPLNVLGGHNAHLVSGWNTSVFEALENLEQGDDALAAIKSVEL